MATLAGGANPDKFDCDGKNTIPRVYSGVSNDMRFLHNGAGEDTGIVIFDFPFSLIADTLVLPYTIYTQSKYGNLCDAKNEKKP